MTVKFVLFTEWFSLHSIDVYNYNLISRNKIAINSERKVIFFSDIQLLQLMSPVFSIPLKLCEFIPISVIVQTKCFRGNAITKILKKKHLKLKMYLYDRNK